MENIYNGCGTNAAVEASYDCSACGLLLVYIFHYFVITFNGVVVSVIVIGNENFDFFR